MVKICFITTTSITLSTFVVETARALHVSGNFDISFICDDDEKFAESLPQFIHFIPVSMQRGVSLKDFTVIGKLINIFKKEKFDIIQYSTPNAALYSSIAGSIAGVKIRLYAQWGIRYVGMNGAARKVFKALEQLVCSLSTDIRAVSPMNLDFAVNEKLYKRSKAKVLGKGGTIGVDLEQYNLKQKKEWREEIRAEQKIESGFVFGFAGRVSIDKGGKELLEAFKQLTANISNVHLMIVGPNEVEDKSLSELIQWAKTSNWVHFTGMVPKNEMCKYYAAMDVLVHPTYREGFGMVLQEAAAMEVAILTTRIPGASEVMEEGISCLLATPKDVSSLLTHMQLLISNEQLVSDISKAARKRVEECFSRPRMIERQIDDYESLIGM